MGERQLRIVAYEEIQLLVAVVVEPDRAGSPFAGVFHPRPSGDFAESAVSLIVKQGAGGKAGDIQVLKPVIVNIGTGHTHSVEGHLGNAGALGDVLGPAIAEIAVKDISDGLLTLAPRGFTAVDEEDIQPSVVVIVQKGDTAAGGFNEKAILGLAVEMAPGDAACRETSVNISEEDFLAGSAHRPQEGAKRRAAAIKARN